MLEHYDLQASTRGATKTRPLAGNGLPWSMRRGALEGLPEPLLHVRSFGLALASDLAACVRPLRASGEGRGDGRYFSLTRSDPCGNQQPGRERIESVARRPRLSVHGESQAATGCDAARPATAPRELPPELIQLAAERGYGNVFRMRRQGNAMAPAAR